MAGISMTVNAENQLSVVERIISMMKDKKFNLLVETFSRANGNSEEEVKILEKKLKYCNRALTGVYKINGSQVVIPFSPAESFSWDLNTERVIVEFGSKEITLCRIFVKTDRRKVLRVTQNPI
jgi:hypothetical protein